MTSRMLRYKLLYLVLWFLVGIESAFVQTIMTEGRGRGLGEHMMNQGN